MLKKLFNFLGEINPDPELIKARDEFYFHVFGNEPKIMHSTDHKNPHIDLYIFPPYENRDYHIIITSGMSNLPMPISDAQESKSYCELLICLKNPDFWAMNLLKLAAEYPFYNKEAIDIYHTMAFGGELGEGSLFSAFIFLEPKKLSEDLNSFILKDHKVKFIQAVPITSAEYQYAINKGPEELEILLDKSDNCVVRDINRVSLI